MRIRRCHAELMMISFRHITPSAAAYHARGRSGHFKGAGRLFERSPASLRRTIYTFTRLRRAPASFRPARSPNAHAGLSRRQGARGGVTQAAPRRFRHGEVIITTPGLGIYGRHLPNEHDFYRQCRVEKAAPMAGQAARLERTLAAGLGRSKRPSDGRNKPTTAPQPMPRVSFSEAAVSRR